MPEVRLKTKVPQVRWSLWDGLYDLVTLIALPVVWCAALFSPKLRTSLRGRSGGVKRWRIGVTDSRPLILLHTASRGEFEAVCPLLDLANEAGTVRMAVSFSSPSVEKAVMSRTDLWAAGYLPVDTITAQRRLITTLRPSVIAVSKHDFWPNMVRAAGEAKVPVILANANFHSRTKRRRLVVRAFNRHFMSRLTAIWTVSEEDKARIGPIVSPSTELLALGDTRYDRAVVRAGAGRARFANLRKALGTGKVIVAGSSWPPEEKLIWPIFAELHRADPTLKLVIAPHEVNEESFRRNSDRAEALGLSVVKFKAWTGGTIDAPALFIDEMGILAELYAVGWVALVGGGFGVGVHSVLEPAAFGIPVLFGPMSHVSHEASLLTVAGGGFIIETEDDLRSKLNAWLNDPTKYHTTADAAGEVVRSRAGVTVELWKRLQEFLPQ